MDVCNTYMASKEIQKIVYYWRRRYSVNCTHYTKSEILQEAYLGAWEAVLKYHHKPFNELLKLVSLAVKWRLCGYISKQSKWKLISIGEHIDNSGYKHDIEGLIDVKGTIDNMSIRERLIVVKTMEGYTMPEIGKSLSISKQRVFQILRKQGK